MLRHLAIMLLLALALTGCGLTPNQQYRIDARVYNATSLGLGAAHAAGKISEPKWADIQGVKVTAKTHLADAYQWLKDNPTLANVPGVQIPSLDPLGIALEALLGYASNFDTVPTDPPTTQPQ